MQPKALVEALDSVLRNTEIDHPYFESWWNDLKTLVNDEFPSLVLIQVGRKYQMNTKKGLATVQCTKENGKTWVMYELEGSSRPGVRWMIGKSWCTDENIQSVTTDARIPNYIKVK